MNLLYVNVFVVAVNAIFYAKTMNDFLGRDMEFFSLILKINPPKIKREKQERREGRDRDNCGIKVIIENIPRINSLHLSFREFSFLTAMSLNNNIMPILCFCTQNKKKNKKKNCEKKRRGTMEQ